MKKRLWAVSEVMLRLSVPNFSELLSRFAPTVNSFSHPTLRVRHLVTSLLLCVVLLAGCRWIAPTPDVGPREVVTAFYRWYVGYPGNPLVDKAYRTSPYLAPAFVDEVDEFLGAMQLGGGDPILLAQDVPQDFSVEAVEVAGDEATALIHLYWSEDSPPAERLVDLALVDGRWRITGVHLVER